jgi:hypothetical protein
MIPIASQSELLDEGLVLLDILLGGRSSSRQTLTSLASRQELHDELYRYFVALAAYGPIDSPRTALEACVAGTTFRPDKRAPLIAHPVQLGNVEARRAEIRARVRIDRLDQEAANTFGPQIFFGWKKTGSSRLSELLADEARRQSRSAAMSLSVRPWETGTNEFRAHVEAGVLVQNLLGNCLPFGRTGVALPARIVDAFKVVDWLEGWLSRALDDRPHPATPQLLILGLLFTTVVRAYLADVVCSLVGVALPLHRLYEDRRDSTHGLLQTRCDAVPNGKPISVKGSYNAFMAVGLLELLLGERMPHPEPSSKGFMTSVGGLSDFGALAPLTKFWGSDGALHRSIIGDLQNHRRAAVLQVAFTQPRAKQGSPWLAPMTFDDLKEWILKHAFPLVKIPDPSKAKITTPKASSPSRAGSAEYENHGHFVTHLRLYAAISIAARLAVSIGKQSSLGLSALGSKYVIRGDGSLNWGGNHRPHSEHRDGFTYDVSSASTYDPWPRTSQPPQAPKSPRFLPAAPRKGEAGKAVEVIGAPLGGGSFEWLRVSKDSQDIHRDPELKAAFDALIGQLILGKSGEAQLWDALGGTPILRTSDGRFDDAGLVRNLIGHVALALSGVVKWIHTSWFEHAFAVRAAAALLASSGLPSRLKETAAYVSDAISHVPFYWLPEDHHNHWHVAFEVSSDPSHSLGATPYRLDSRSLKPWLSLWDTLGVDLNPMRQTLDNYGEIDGTIFRDAANERQALLDALKLWQTTVSSLSETERASRTTLQDQAVGLIGTSIASSKWTDIPSLASAGDFGAWIREAPLIQKYKSSPGKVIDWQFWPSQTEEPDPERTTSTTPADEAL